MRRWVPVLVLLAAAAFPASALADPPVNDTQAGAAALPTTYSYTTQVSPVTIPSTGPAGGWYDAPATSPDDDQYQPTCLGAAGYHSMWYKVVVPEAAVLTVTLSSSDVQRYQPVVSIIGPTGVTTTATELACGIGGTNPNADPGATASSYVAAGSYLVRIASVVLSNGQLADLPTLTLKGVLRDVTAPTIRVLIPRTVLGVGKQYRFDARNTSDAGSGIAVITAAWAFNESGSETHPSKHSANPLIGLYAWRTPGLHRVTLQVKDLTQNLSTYTFFVLVHNFVAPTVAVRVFVPSPGARQIKLVINHDMPISVRLVILQRGRVLAVVPARRIKGSRVKSTIHVALRSKVSRNGFVVISGIAGDLGEHPNNVPLPTCAVDPVNGGGVCR